MESNGLECWIAPRDIPAGSYPEQIDDGINRSRCVLLILSESSNESNWVLREITTAASLNKIILSFQIQRLTPRKGLRILISDQQGLSAWESAATQYFAQLTSMLKQTCKDSEIESKSVSNEPISLGDTSKSNKKLKSKIRSMHAVVAIAIVAVGSIATTIGVKNWPTSETPQDPPTITLQPLPTTFSNEPETHEEQVPIKEHTPAVLDEDLVERNFAKIEFHQRRDSLNIDGWPESAELRSEANRIISTISDQTGHAQAIELYTQATAKLTEAESVYSSARPSINQRLNLAREIREESLWCEQCPDIIKSRDHLAAELRKIETDNLHAEMSSTSELIAAFFVEVSDLKIRNSAEIIKFQDSQRSLIQIVEADSRIIYDRASALFSHLNELKHPEQATSAFSISLLEISRQATLCLATLDDRNQDLKTTELLLTELNTLMNQSKPITHIELSRAKTIQEIFQRTASLLEGYVNMLHAELDAQKSIIELRALFKNTPSNQDESITFYLDSLASSVRLRESAISNASTLQATHATVAFEELFASIADAKFRNRNARYLIARNATQSISSRIHEQYSQAFERGLRIPHALQNAQDDFELSNSVSQPTEIDITFENNLAMKFGEAQSELDALAQQARDSMAPPYSFHTAAASNNLHLLIDYYALGVSINSKRPTDSKTALHIASTNGHIEMARWISSQADVDFEAFDEKGYTPYALAAISGKESIIHLLANLNVNILPKNYDNVSVAFERPVLQSRNMMMLILNQAERKDRSVATIWGVHGRTLLIEICNSGGRGGLTEDEQIEIAKKLIDLGIDPLQRGDDRINARAMAEMNGADSLVRFLIEHGG